MLNRIVSMIPVLDKPTAKKLSEGSILTDAHLSEITDVMLETTEFEVLRTGMFYDARYGTFEVTKEMIKNLADNFNNNVLGVQIAVDKGHEWQDGAIAWVSSVHANGDYSKLYATFKEYTDEGKEMFQQKKFKYFSVEFAPFESVDSLGNKTTTFDVLRGIAATNRPVIKGMKPAFYSESLFLNFSKMDKFKLFAEELKAKAKISKEEMGKLNGMFAMLSEDEQKEAQPAVDESAAKVEEPAAPAAPADPEKPADPAAPTAELSEKNKKGVSLAEFTELQNTVKILSEKNAKLSEDLEAKELSETFKETLMLSKSTQHGFEKGDEEAVTGFMKTLSEDQRKQFSDLVAKVKSVDLSTIGSGPAGAARVLKFSAESVAELAEQFLSEGKAKDITEAQKMATKELQAK